MSPIENVIKIATWKRPGAKQGHKEQFKHAPPHPSPEALNTIKKCKVIPNQNYGIAF
jgi:hypothetical protein